MNITIFGSGYVGLVTGACLAEVGNRVMCIDVDAARIASLQDGVVPIHEPGLPELIRANHARGTLQFTTDAGAAVAHAQLQFVAVGTPADEDGSADLSYVLEVAETIATHMQAHRIVVNKSTVPVGTADQVRTRMQAVLAARAQHDPSAADLHCTVVSNPEFLKEGAAVADFMKPDRIVIGSDDEAASVVMRELYAPFNRNHDRVLEMDVRSAELTKYAANVMLATRISLMNEFANLADRLGADIESVRLGIGSDPRIGFQYIYPGCGYGGSCFPKDVQALGRTADDIGYTAPIIKGVEVVNERQKRLLLEKINAHFDGQLAGRTFALWGLAFKPNTDDMRCAPSRTLMEGLWAAGARVQAYDPVAGDATRRLYGERDDLTLCANREDALQGADGLAIVTEWNEFKSADTELLKSRLQTPVVFDGRNLYDPDMMERHGIAYYAVGRGRRPSPAAFSVDNSRQAASR